MTASYSLKPATDSLYDTDYVQWVESTLQKLQQKDYTNVDWENLLDEIGDMSRKERRAIESNLVVLLMHLLNGSISLSVEAEAGLEVLLSIVAG